MATPLLKEASESQATVPNRSSVRTGGDMGITALMLLTLLAGTMRTEPTQRLNSSSSPGSPSDGSQIKISIATGGGPYRPAKDTYRVGERIPVVITMTN